MAVTFESVLDRILPIPEYFMAAEPPLYSVPDPSWRFFNSSSITTTSTAMMTAATMMT